MSSLCRFITCGSVDDGKSTFIGRLLYDSKMILQDQLLEIEQNTKKYGNTSDPIDFSLLVDGLASEREQGITIDVAYKFFSMPQRKFIIADTPGHEQYTRNMVTGASTADIAIILIDARYGVLTQTKRHSYIVSLLGIKNIIIAINKMDLVDYSQSIFQHIEVQYREIIPQLPNYQDIVFNFIPISALRGDNVVDTSQNMQWYKESSLMELLLSTRLYNDNLVKKDFRFPVQYVNRTHLDFRGYSGTIVSGSIKVGENVSIFPSMKSTKVSSIILPDISLCEVDEANVNTSITLTLEDELDISRGDIIFKSDTSPKVSTSFQVNLVWMDEEPMQLGKKYIIKRANSLVNAQFSKIIYKKDINSFDQVLTDKLELNDIALCFLEFEREIFFEEYAQNRFLGSFIVIDKYTNNTVGAGMISDIHASREVHNKKYTQDEIALNRYIREKFPEWKCEKI